LWLFYRLEFWLIYSPFSNGFLFHGKLNPQFVVISGKSKDKRRNKHRKGDAHTEFLQLSKDDYFAKNNEFAAWLKEEKNVFFSDLLSESARELFTDFVKAWNKGKLDSHYYEGIASGPRTSHNWKIKK
ncbi:style cell-cycle inhibitor 1-A, partial [Vigna umbellata]|uniref:style cell-cycle inhibitor 1-A n=1 Tax=Vigna umbellata TaxID=87088 RepID=UPI001F5EF109